LADAVADVAGGGTPLGGGTDLVVRARQGLVAPVMFVSTERVDTLRALSSTEDGIVVGGSVTLDRLAGELGGELPVVAEAVATIASPQIRAMATVAGNLLQANRCWFLRNGFDCYKRGGVFRPCYAVAGDHRFYHAALGAHRCQAVTPSDLATVLSALDATVEVESESGRREIPVGRLYRGPGESALRPDELLTSVRIGAAARGRAAAFEKLRMYEGDFAVASAAVSAVIEDARWRGLRIVLGSIAPTPWRAHRTETALEGTVVDARRLRVTLDEELERDGHPLARNAWKLDAVAALAERGAGRLVDAPR
jgi:CO/xanthine dehydrogenase FAD-binding subunit